MTIIKRNTTLLRKEYRNGVGTVAVYNQLDSEGYPVERVVSPTREYISASKLIDRIFTEKGNRNSTQLNKNNLGQYVV